jgi:hypothetical protein
MLIESPWFANYGRMPGFTGHKTTKPGARPGFSFNENSGNPLPGARYGWQRSARARGHSRRYAGGGQDIGSGMEGMHGVKSCMDVGSAQARRRRNEAVAAETQRQRSCGEADASP